MGGGAADSQRGVRLGCDNVMLFILILKFTLRQKRL